VDCVLPAGSAGSARPRDRAQALFRVSTKSFHRAGDACVRIAAQEAAPPTWVLEVTSHVVVLEK
jgi:hypothetical protein